MVNVSIALSLSNLGWLMVQLVMTNDLKMLPCKTGFEVKA